MRYLVLADLHANLEATEAVLQDARAQGYDEVLVLGDLVGYGASPNEVLDLVRSLPLAVLVRGNHDKAASGITDGETFNEIAREAALWTRAVLAPEHARYLRQLPEGPLRAGGAVICHGAPLDEEEYLLGDADASRSFTRMEFDAAFFGHTHFASVFHWHEGRILHRFMPGEGGALPLEPGKRYLINPGSVGQPRDRVPMASYLLYEPDRGQVVWRRVAYDRDAAAARIVRAGLPELLGQRLLLGM